MARLVPDRRLHTIALVFVLVLGAGIAGVDVGFRNTTTAATETPMPTEGSPTPTEPTTLLDETVTPTPSDDTPTLGGEPPDSTPAPSGTPSPATGTPGGDPPDDDPPDSTPTTGPEQATGLLLQDAEVLPGDRGENTRTASNVLDREATLSIDAIAVNSSENGINEPEEKAGDTTTTQGELDTTVLVHLFVRRPDGTTVSLAGSSSSFVPARTLDGDSYTDVATLGANESAAVGLAWRLPSDTGNQVQTDDLTVSLTVVLES
jgi:hypothetical protein